MDLNNLLKHGLDFKDQLSKLQKSFENQEFEAVSGGGLVKVKIKGSRKIISLEIDESLILKKEKAILSDLIIAAINNAQTKLENKYKEHFGTMITQVPGLDKLPPFSC